MESVPIADAGALFGSWSDEEAESPKNDCQPAKKIRRGMGARRRTAKTIPVLSPSETPECAATVPTTPSLTRTRKARAAPAKTVDISASATPLGKDLAPAEPPGTGAGRTGVSARARKMAEAAASAAGVSILVTPDAAEPATPQRPTAAPATPKRKRAEGPGEQTPQRTPQRALQAAAPSPAGTAAAASPGRTPGKGREAALPLPARHRVLLEQFVALDHGLNLCRSRREAATLDRLSASVRTITKRAFGERQFAQLLAAWPAAYSVSLQKGSEDPATRAGVGTFSDSRHRLLVELPAAEFAPAEGGAPPPSRLNARRRAFRRALEDAVIAHHAVFLKAKGLEVDPAAVRAWHPEFPLEDIVPAELPRPPKPPAPAEVLARLAAKREAAAAAASPAAPVFAAVPGTAAFDRRAPPARGAPRNVAEEALAAVLEKRAAADAAAAARSAEAAAAAAAIAARPVDPALRGIDPAILARVRAKEQRRAMERITGAPEARERALAAGRLPALAEALRAFLIGERNPPLLLAILAPRLAAQQDDPSPSVRPPRPAPPRPAPPFPSPLPRA
eukprot:tig00000624_g2648.t1